jgi:hypothetical protein
MCRPKKDEVTALLNYEKRRIYAGYLALFWWYNVGCSKKCTQYFGGENLVLNINNEVERSVSPSLGE